MHILNDIPHFTPNCIYPFDQICIGDCGGCGRAAEFSTGAGAGRCERYRSAADWVGVGILDRRLKCGRKCSVDGRALRRASRSRNSRPTPRRTADSVERLRAALIVVLGGDPGRRTALVGRWNCVTRSARF